MAAHQLHFAATACLRPRRAGRDHMVACSPQTEQRVRTGASMNGNRWHSGWKLSSTLMVAAGVVMGCTPAVVTDGGGEEDIGYTQEAVTVATNYKIKTNRTVAGAVRYLRLDATSKVKWDAT